MSRPNLPADIGRLSSTPDIRMATLLDMTQLTPTKSALDAKYDTYQK